MYLLTSINVQESGYEIVVPHSSKKECEEALDELQRKVWYNNDGTQKMMSDIYDDTRAKNAIIVSNKKAAQLLGGRSNLDLALDCLSQATADAIDEAAAYEKWLETVKL